MATGVASWSQTAASNATADAGVNWAEGQSPSSVNDSARAMMASVAKYRDDIAGGITTGGTSTAYTVTSNQGFASLSALDKQIIAFVPHATNTGPTTLNVDGLGAKALQATLSDGLAGGELITGTPYVATWINGSNCFLLHNAGMYTAASPLGVVLDYAGATTAPNSRYALCYGQAISRTTYAGLFNLMGTSWGTGDGSTTFTLPDLRGRFVAGYDSMGGVAASRMTIGSGGVAGTFTSAGGSQSHTLAEPELPALTKTVSFSSGTYNPGQLRATDNTGANATVFTAQSTSNVGSATAGSGGGTIYLQPLFTTIPSYTPAGTVSFGSGSSFAQIPPCAVMSKIIRIL